MLSRRDWLTTAAASLLALIHSPRILRAAPVPSPSLVVYKDADCSCCGPWVEYLRGEGYQVSVIQEPSHAALQQRKDELRVPPAMRSCHTGVLAVPSPLSKQHYLIEGHVPAEAIARLPAEQPQILGLSVPGMPSGTPGMEWPASTMEEGEYEVIAFGPRDATRAFGRYQGRRRPAKP